MFVLKIVAAQRRQQQCGVAARRPAVPLVTAVAVAILHNRRNRRTKSTKANGGIMAAWRQNSISVSARSASVDIGVAAEA